MWTIFFFLPLKNWDILVLAWCKVQLIFSNIQYNWSVGVGVGVQSGRDTSARQPLKVLMDWKAILTFCANILS
jgi:hypothetical protein